MTEVLLVCGSGGVGKTTVSAALGLHFAQLGKKVVVITIDPAKRLATALGLNALLNTPQKITTAGELFAMQLDTKKTFDQIVRRYASSAEVCEKIFANKIYQHMSQMLAGSQEYMAIEKLYEIWQQQNFDVIILDTPPVQNAVDFLAAPDKLSNMISNSMLHLLIKPSVAIGKVGMRFFAKGSQQILKIFDRLVGFAFLQDISDMLVLFEDLLSGFHDRAAATKSLLQSADTRFIAVGTTEPNSVAETMLFQERLQELGYHLQKIIVNRVYPEKSATPQQIKKDQMALTEIYGAKDAAILTENYQRFLPLISKDAEQIMRLAKKTDRKNIVTIPLFLSDVHDIKSLEHIAEHLQSFE